MPTPPTANAEEAVMVLTFAVRELTAELARFRRFSEQADNISTPSLHYANGAGSWAVFRERRVRLLAALVWGGIGLATLELAHRIF